jgi:peptidoglycan/xylan/chitin deacetylase (PgdA/CDA1 family)
VERHSDPMKNLIILAYHKIEVMCSTPISVALRDFGPQMEFLLSRGWKCLTLKELYERYLGHGGSVAEKTFVVTFDDGYGDIYDLAFPVLRSLGLRATAFLIVHYVNHILGDGRVSGSGRPERFLTWDQVYEMQEYGIEFGSHTLTHGKLTELSPHAAYHEIKESKVHLEGKLGKPVISLCYPKGAFNDAIVNMAREAGYKLAVVTPPEPSIAEQPYSLHRIGVYEKDSAWRFRLKVSPLFPIIRPLLLRTKRLKQAGISR